MGMTVTRYWSGWIENIKDNLLKKEKRQEDQRITQKAGKCMDEHQMDI